MQAGCGQLGQSASQTDTDTDRRTVYQLLDPLKQARLGQSASQTVCDRPYLVAHAGEGLGKESRRNPQARVWTDQSIMQESDDVTLNFGEEDEVDHQRPIKHRVAVFFHIFFRVAAILTYLLCEFFSSSFITNFIVIILLLCMDFWTTKNVTGRLLVGLRWWNYVDDKGESHWVYESRKGTPGSRRISAMESRIFWLSMVVSQVLWVFFSIASLFRLNFKWFMVVTVGFLMNGANLYGYVRCKYGTRQKFTSVAKNVMSTQFIKSMFTGGSAKGNATEDKTDSTHPEAQQ